MLRFSQFPYGNISKKQDLIMHNEELHSLYSSQSIIRMIKSRRFWWAEHVARMERRERRTGYWWGTEGKKPL
jgi:hypothetical protein